MIEIRPTEDLVLLRSFLRNPQCYRRMTNDSAPDIAAFDVVPGLNLEYLIAQSEEGYAVGLFVLKPLTAPYAEVHFCISPEAWGNTKPIAEAFLQYVWSCTSYGTLIGPLPAHNRLALKLALSLGFTQWARRPHFVRKHGQFFDLLILGLNRPESST